MTSLDAQSALQRTVHQLKQEFRLHTTLEPNMLLVPKRKDHVKLFAQAIVEIWPEAGSAPYVFDQLWRLERQCHFMGLEVFISNEVDDLTVDFNLDAHADEEPSVQ